MSNPPSNELTSLATFTDGITKLEYLQKDNKSLLASTSWDGSFRLHDTSSKSAILAQGMESGPLLSLACSAKLDGVATGGLDGSGKLPIRAPV